MRKCPECKSTDVIKFGIIRRRSTRQRYLCRSCGRSFLGEEVKK